MITCQLQFIDAVPDIADEFKNFECGNIEDLLHKLISTCDVLQKNQTIPHAEIILKLNFHHISINQTHLKTLVQYLSQRSQFILRAEIQNDIHHFQPLFDRAYLGSLKAWHSQTYRQRQLQEGIPLSALIPSPKNPYLAVVTQRNAVEPIEQTPTEVISYPERTIAIAEIPKIKLDTHPKFQALIDEVRIFHDIIPSLYAYGGLDGVVNLFCLFKNFPNQSMLEAFNTLFLRDNLLNIQDLMAPSGQEILQLCLNWPPLFLKHFLCLVGHHNGVELKRLRHFVSAMNSLWSKIADYELQLAEEIANYDFDFFQRINLMLELLDHVPESWKKYQIQFIFDLNWQLSDEITTLRSHYHCKWIHPQMFDADLRTKNFYRNTARLIKNTQVEQLETYLKHLNTSHASPEKFKLLSWFLSLAKIPALDELTNILIWFEQQPSTYQQTIVNYLNETVIDAEISIDDFKALLQLSQNKGINFIALIQYQLQWSKQFPEMQNAYWKTLFNFLTLRNISDISLLQGLIEDESSYPFNLTYFQTLMYLIFADVNDEKMAGLIAAYQHYDEPKQELILSILRSIKISAESAPISSEGFLNLLKAHQDANQGQILLQTEWQQEGYFPETIKFSYFENNINYQRIFDSLERICQKLIQNIQTITTINVPILGIGISTILHPECLKGLRTQTEKIQGILQGLQQLKLSKDKKFALDGTFTELQDVETYFEEFFATKLETAFNSKLVISLLPRLDSQLNQHSNFKNLFDAICKNFDEVPRAIADFFDPQMLKDLQESAEGESVVMKMMDKQLVESIRQELTSHLTTNLVCDPRIESHKLDPLHFLGKMELSQEGIVKFFTRLQNFTIISSEWPNIEAKCLQYGQDPLAIWQLCIKHQTHQLKPSNSAYWRSCFDVLERLFKHHDSLDKGGPKSFLKLLEMVLNQKLHFLHELVNGEITAPAWQIFLKFLEKSFATPEIYQSSHFLYLFPIGMQSTLENAKPFKFSETMRIFSDLGDHDNQFLPMLVTCLEHANEAQQTQAQALIAKLGPIFQDSTNRPWLDLLRIILTPANLEHHLNKILNILDCIQDYPEFDLLTLIINDESWKNKKHPDEGAKIQELNALIDIFKNMPQAWVIGYHQTFGRWIREPAQTSNTILAIAPSLDSPPPAQPNLFNLLWFFFSKPETIPKTIETKAASNALINEEPPPANYWPIINQKPYPSIAKLTLWLSEESPQKLSHHIDEFDIKPSDHPAALPRYTAEDFRRWINELECYDGTCCPKQKERLFNRLESIWEYACGFYTQSRQVLRREFNQTILKLQHDPNANPEALQNQLIGLLAAIYQKIDQKMPYPTQILALLMALEYDNHHLIAEVDTSEGKATIIALLAVLKWVRKDQKAVVVYTHTRDLVTQDFNQKKHHFLFSFLNIPASKINENSPFNQFKANGIYYTTQDDMSVFLEKQRLNGIKYDFPMDIIVDEVDELILDQNSKIHLVEINPDTQGIKWLYPQINQFISQQRNSSTLHLNPDAWGVKLKEFIFELNKTKRLHIQKIKGIPEAKWLNWLKAGLYADSLIENEHFIAQEIESDDGPLFTTLPYINSTPKHGYQLAYLSYEGIPQLLHARLSSVNKQFVIEDETHIISQLPGIDFRHVGNVTGFSGSIGGVRELLSMQAILQAKSIRIGRFHQKDLDEHPPLLLKNQAEQLSKIVEMINALEQPVLIVSRKIEDAEDIFAHLQKHHHPHKKIKLLTGQESEASRSRWLYEKSGQAKSLYAGAKHCVTVATQICGRGTDIHVSHPQGLYVILTDVLDPRNFCQTKGRAARAGHHGDLICLFNANGLKLDWGYLKLPELSPETLSCWIPQIQKELLFSQTEQRLVFSGQSWSYHHLSDYLDNALSEVASKKIRLAQKKLRLLIDQTLEEGQTFPARFETYKQKTIEIWAKLLNYLEFLGLGHIRARHHKDAFANYLESISLDDWQTIVQKAEPAFEPEHSEALRDEQRLDKRTTNETAKYQVIIDEQKFIQLKQMLAPHVPLQKNSTNWFNYLSNWFFGVLAWFNPSAQKLKTCLNHNWHTFAKTPNLHTWSNFYETLLSAKKLSLRQQKNRLWRIDYWLNAWHPLREWNTFQEKTEKYFKQNLSVLKTGANPKQLAIAKITDKISEPLVTKQLQPFTEKKYGLVFKLMRYLYPKTYDLLNQTHESWRLVRDNESNLENWDGFMQQLAKLKTFYQSNHATSFWLLSYWLYYFQPWLTIKTMCKSTLTQSQELPLELKKWLSERENKSDMRLRYIGHLMCQEQIKTKDIRYHFNFFARERFLGKLQQEYESFQKTSDLDVEIDELSRYFLSEFQLIHQAQNPRLPQDMNKELSEEERFNLCIAVLKTFIAPICTGSKNAFELQSNSKALQVLVDELEQWSERRDLIRYFETV